MRVKTNLYSIQCVRLYVCVCMYVHVRVRVFACARARALACACVRVFACVCEVGTQFDGHRGALRQAAAILVTTPGHVLGHGAQRTEGVFSSAVFMCTLHSKSTRTVSG